jgi:arabinogalactan oligomer/maltooligosaccharide transport system permease protein
MTDLRRRYALPFLFLAPASAVLLLVVLYPFLYNVVIAFSNMSLYHLRDWSFIGLEHFRTIFSEPAVWSVFLKTVIWTTLNVVSHLTLGVGLALLLNQEIRGRALYRALLILPWAMPQYITALTWRGMFNYEYGAINLGLRALHLPPMPWLSNEGFAFAAPILANIWLGFPFMMVIALGGLQSIPRELYEAAAIDGAGWWFRLRKITLPLLRPVLVPAAILGTIWTFNNLNVIWLVTNQGEPADKTHILVTYVYKAAFHYYRYGYAAAFSLVIFALLLAFVVAFLRANREKEGAA